MCNYHRFPARTRPWKPLVTKYVFGALAYLAWGGVVIWALTEI